MSSIPIGGEERPIKVCWGMLKEYSILTGRSFSELFSVADSGFDDIEALIFTALKWGAKKEGQEFKVKKENITEWLDESMAVIPDFMEIFQKELSSSLEKKSQAPEAGQ